MPLKIFGLNPLALAVRDPERSLQFYRDGVGARECWRGEGEIHVTWPRTRDILVFQRDRRRAAAKGGLDHFGFRLQDAKDLAKAAETIRRAGGTIVDAGEFEPGESYVFARDPDGYTIEFWSEK